MSRHFSEVALDQFDLKMLSILQRHGRMSKVELANAIGLSPSPCLARMKRLENAGFIVGYHAEIDISKIVNTTKIFTEIALQNHRSDDFERFEQEIMNIDEIVECNATGGGVDYILKTIVINIDHYQKIIESLLERDIGISRYYTYIVTKSIKNNTGTPDFFLTDRRVQEVSSTRRR